MTGNVSAIGNGTAEGALQYLDFLSSKGHVSPGAIAALKTGFSKVMKVVGGDEWEKVEVRNVDLESYMARFANMTHGQYTSNSLIDYKSRVKKVVTWYLEFLAKPGWTPDVKTRVRSVGKKMGQDAIPTTTTNNQTPEAPTQQANVLGANDPPSRANLIAFPFPLSDGVLATLYLPAAISAPDAARLARFVETLVVEVPIHGKK